MKKLVSILLCAILLLGCSTAFASSYSYITFSGSCNVRSGPGLSYTSIGSVTSGSTLPYLSQTSVDSRGVTWYKVSFRETYGWVSSVYATPTNTPGIATYGGGTGGESYSSGTSSSSSTSTTTSAYVRATGTVNVRSGPGLSYDSINTLHEGEEVPYLGNSSYDSRGVLWYQIQDYSYGTYWVSSTYAELVGGTVITTTGSTVYASGGSSNIRSGPAITYSKVAILSEGEYATYLGSSSTDERGVVWYYVSYAGETGWVSSRYTTLY